MRSPQVKARETIEAPSAETSPSGARSDVDHVWRSALRQGGARTSKATAASTALTRLFVRLVVVALAAGVAVTIWMQWYSSAHFQAADAAVDLKSDTGRLASIALVSTLVAGAGGALWWDGRRRRDAARRAETSSLARFEAIVEHGSDLIVLTGPDGSVTYVSPSLKKMLGYERRAYASIGLGSLVHVEDSPVLRTLYDNAVADGEAGPADFRIRHADGGWRIMEMVITDLRAVPDVAGVVWCSRDVTERRRLESELSKAALEDSLTGLANRAVFRDRVTQAAARVSRQHRPIAVLLADLDRFKEVNDSLGHDTGDLVLVEVAARLGRCVRPGDTVARLGGDEFTVLLEGVTDLTIVDDVAARLIDLVSQPIKVAGSDIRVGASIGVAYSLDGAETAEELLRNADAAMYSAKSLGRGRAINYEPIMHQRAEDRLRMSSDLDQALERGQLTVFYQPTFHMATGAIEGTEALLRWRHPDRGIVFPGVFIPLAEQTGQILKIGRYVLEQACLEAVAWQSSFPTTPGRTMSVNLSGCQLADEHLVSDVRAVIAATRVDPYTLVLEITESVLVADVESVTRTLHELKELGIRLAIDDFGTGYSSLAYLRQFPVDILKIDRTFVDAATSGAAGGEAVVRAIVGLGQSLHLATIAEGIEARAQAEQLLSVGCTTGQGFYFAHPMPAEELTQLLARSTPRRAAELTRR